MDKYEVLVNMRTYAQMYLERRIEATEYNEEMNMKYIHELEDIKELYNELAEKINNGELYEVAKEN